MKGKETNGVHVGATSFLGVKATAVQSAGAFVVQVLPTSAAAVAGVVPGDLIVGMAGQAVRSPDTVSSVLAAYDPGAKLPVQLLDQTGAPRTVTITLVAGPPA